jgi:hypothetical protein
MVAGAVLARVEHDLGQRLRRIEGIEDKRHGRAVPAEKGEIHAVRQGGRS